MMDDKEYHDQPEKFEDKEMETLLDEDPSKIEKDLSLNTC